ncbi:MAG: hypothetical protein SO181_04055 [Frisingicoccus sp.]|uniref:hypothetical protein n=1 Tax=Frisingicoccus sp. TaxID=1918627 RepID=UPI002A821463|nr:hypothetical protein [Frisingicoccus sp.]MDY4834307.1 hypothetical protein [Frisingicoccus sp.]
MTHSGMIFVILLILNALAAVIYLIWYLVFKKDKDNRKQYVMNMFIMLLCPVVGILYFFLAFLKFHFIKLGERDLSDVEFSKKHQTSRVKADEERERNIVAVGEAILVSDQEQKRANMLNVLLGDTEEALSAIALALNSDDSEVAHYAASFLQSKMDAFREKVSRMQKMIEEGNIEDEECQDHILELIWYMNHMLKQKVFMQVEQVDYVDQMEQLCEKLFQNARSKISPECYEWILSRIMDLGEYERAEVWGYRFSEQYPDVLSAFTLRLKLYFETNQKEKFFEVMGQLRASDVLIDNRTLEMIRMIQM